MVSGEIKKGNKRLQLSISEQADTLLRQHALNKGQKSAIVDELIIEKYEQKAANCE